MKHTKRDIAKTLRLAATGMMLSIILFLLSYACTNSGFTFLNDMLVTKSVYAVKNTLTRKPSVPENVVLINVQYDKQLVKAQRDKGVVAITNRDSLYSFLTKLDVSGSYNYIFMDIAFDKEDVSPCDSLLFNTIRSMPRIVIADSRNMDPRYGLERKAGRVDYKTTFSEGGLSSYIIEEKGHPSFASKAYYELQGRSIRSFIWGLVCFDGRKLALRAVTPKERVHLPLPRKHEPQSERIVDNMHEQYTLTLGSEVLRNWDMFVQDGDDFFEGKDIVIGDFSDDRHNSYMGEVYGPLMNYNAYLSLINQEHLLKWKPLIFLLICILSLLAVHENRRRFPGWLFGVVAVLISWVLSAGSFFLFGQSYNVIMVILFVELYSQRMKIRSFVNRLFRKQDVSI